MRAAAEGPARQGARTFQGQQVLLLGLVNVHGAAASPERPNQGRSAHAQRSRAGTSEPGSSCPGYTHGATNCSAPPRRKAGPAGAQQAMCAVTDSPRELPEAAVPRSTTGTAVLCRLVGGSAQSHPYRAHVKAGFFSVARCAPPFKDGGPGCKQGWDRAGRQPWSQ